MRDAELPPARSVATMAAQLKIHDAPSFDAAAGIVKAVKAERARIETARKSITGPLQDAMRATQALFRPVLDAYDEAEGAIKREIARYSRAAEESRVAAMVAARPVDAPPVAGGISIRKVRRFRVSNPDAVPRQFCSPDEEKIKAHLDAGGIEAIAGVEFYDDEIVTVRS